MLTSVTFPDHSLHIGDPVKQFGASLDLLVLVQVVHLLELDSWRALGQSVDHQLVLAVKLTEVGTTSALVGGHQTVLVGASFEVIGVEVHLISSYLVRIVSPRITTLYLCFHPLFLLDSISYKSRGYLLT